MKSSWGRSVWDLAAGVAFASSGFALVYIDNWPGGQWFPLWDSHSQKWSAMGRVSQPSTTQRVWTHQRRSHWINRHGTLSGRFDFEKMDTLFRAGGIDIVTLTMCEYQKFKLHIAHFQAGMWRSDSSLEFRIVSTRWATCVFVCRGPIVPQTRRSPYCDTVALYCVLSRRL